jgi:hypothetical protein
MTCRDHLLVRVVACTAVLFVSVQAFGTSRPPDPGPEDVKLSLIEGVTSTGEAKDLWKEMIRKLRSGNPSEPTTGAKVLTPPERAWVDLIASRIPAWQSEIPRLASNFIPVVTPNAVRVVIGNRGGEDAFTHDVMTIGFDVARLHALYGDAAELENRNRMDRFFRHEYVHLLQKAWLIHYPYKADTPLRVALLGIWTEGLGNFYSLSGRWRTPAGTPSDAARKTLAELTPRFTARLGALACAAPERGPILSADLSMGPFDRKWGALPAALWLDDEVRQSEDALRQFVLAGPDGVWALADRNLPDSSRAVLSEVRAAAALCEAR